MRTKKIISMGLNEIVGREEEYFLDLLEELFFADEEEEQRYTKVLSNFSYEAVGVTDGLIDIEVVGDVITI